MKHLFSNLITNTKFIYITMPKPDHLSVEVYLVALQMYVEKKSKVRQKNRSKIKN